ncbi:hypothetical protein [Streptomyces sp. NBC_01304]|uniref:hypothetical protein n=1 Tax=Streptomyces sp. NBC_01304 TaxID=2903818 RepID=UPI002E0FA98A|nr:hypothetical protein OG430_18325 [Streptomyces sp. NBC_01304]
MTVDPSDPDTFEAQQESEPPAEETPEADAAEQHTDLQQHHDDPPHYDPAGANPADAVEQARVVDLDEDDYR